MYLGCIAISMLNGFFLLNMYLNCSPSQRFTDSFVDCVLRTAFLFMNSYVECGLNCSSISTIYDSLVEFTLRNTVLYPLFNGSFFEFVLKVQFRSKVEGCAYLCT